MAESLGHLLVTLRHARGLTQMELCARVSHVVGLVQPQISELEHDNMVPNAGQLEHIMRALEATDQDRRRCRDLAAAGVVRR